MLMSHIPAVGAIEDYHAAQREREGVNDLDFRLQAPADLAEGVRPSWSSPMCCLPAAFFGAMCA